MVRVLYRNKSEQHELKVYDTKRLYEEQGHFRVLEFSNEAVQGAMDLDQPARIVLEYPRAMVHLMEHNASGYESVYIIGHGIGTLTSYLSGKQVKVAELDEEVLEISRTFFGYEGDHVRVGDGRELLQQESSGAYDYIIVDAFTADGTPKQLISIPFFEIVKMKLSAEGMVMMNVFGRAGNDRLVNAIHTTLCELFVYTRSFALPVETEDEQQNRILVASNQPITFQAKHMAGFVEQELGEGYVIQD